MHRINVWKTSKIAVLGLTAILGTGQSLAAAADAVSVTAIESQQRSLPESRAIIFTPENTTQSYYVATGQQYKTGVWLRGTGADAVELSCPGGASIVAEGRFDIRVDSVTTERCSISVQNGRITALSRGTTEIKSKGLVTRSDEGIFAVNVHNTAVEASMLSGNGSVDYLAQSYPLEPHSKMVLSQVTGLSFDVVSTADAESSADALSRVAAVKAAASEAAVAEQRIALKQQYLQGFIGSDTAATANIIPADRYAMEVEEAAALDQVEIAGASAEAQAAVLRGAGSLEAITDKDVTTMVLDNLGPLLPATDQYGRPIQ